MTHDHIPSIPGTRSGGVLLAVGLLLLAAPAVGQHDLVRADFPFHNGTDPGIFEDGANFFTCDSVVFDYVDFLDSDCTGDGNSPADDDSISN